MALEYLDRGETAPSAWVNEQVAFIEQAKKPQAQLLLMVAPSVEKLIRASGGGAVSTALPPQ